MFSKKRAAILLVLLLVSVPAASADKLYGDALIYASNAGTGHPYIDSFNNIQGGETNIDAASRGSFNLFEYPNGGSGTIEVSMFDDAGDFDITRTGSYTTKCTLSTWEQDFSSSEDGYAHVDQGVIVGQSGTWPGRNSGDVAYKSFDSGNNPLGEKTAKDIYDRMSGAGNGDGHVYTSLDTKSSEILDGGEFVLKGDMICGDADSDGNAEWYICDGNMAYSSSQIQGKVCNEAAGTWEDYSGCADETLGYAGGMINYHEAAFWEPDPNGDYYNSANGCTYNHKSPEDYSQYEDWGYDASPVNADENSPEIFECYKDGTIDNYYVSDQGTNYESDSRTQAKNACEAVPSGGTGPLGLISMPDHFAQFGGEPMPMVQYYVPTSAIPDGEEASSYISTYGDYKGLETHRFQTLYEAMMTYDGGVYDTSCDNCTDIETWQNNSLVTANYDESDHTTYDTAFKTANLGGNVEEQIIEESPYSIELDSSGEPQNSDVFPGGFAGKCEGTLVWQTDTDVLGSGPSWTCSQAVDYTQEVFFPTLELAENREMVAVGFHIMPQLFNSSYTPSFDSDIPPSFNYQTGRVLPQQQNFKELSAVCWWGDTERYTNLEEANEGQTWFAVEYTDMPTNPQNPIPVWGELNKTIKQNLGLQGPSCKWAYTAEPNLDMLGGSDPDVYSISGTIEPVGNVNTLAQNRGFSAGSGVSVSTDYTGEMSSNTFRTFSEVWENDAGYSRTDLGCVPGETYFNYNVTMPCTYDPVLPPGGFCPIYGCTYY